MKASSTHAKRAHELTERLFGEDLHAKRVLSLANAVRGAVVSSSLAVHAIGQGMTFRSGLQQKHTVKQVDRLLSNPGLDVAELAPLWVKYCVASRSAIVVAMDWTDFDPDDHTTIKLNMVTKHGRATPLMWKTVVKSELKGKRNQHEDELLAAFKKALPADVSVTILADRGFGDTKLFNYLQVLGFHYIIRCRQNTFIATTEDDAKPGVEWVYPNGRARKIEYPRLTAQGIEVPSIVTVKASGMKEPWILIVSDRNMTAASAVKLYSKRFQCEENFRDVKNARFGMGMSQLRISRIDRRDRLLLISAVAVAFLTLLGAAGENTGLDMKYKTNTVKTRVHSLFRQGCMYYESLPTMREAWIIPLIEEFERLLAAQEVARAVLGVL
jgi:hypothetical protein